MSKDGIEVSDSRPYRVYQLRPGAANAERRGCPDCAHLVGHISWWCGNKEATAAHYSNLPGRVGCAFWEAAPMKPPGLAGAFCAWLKRLWR